MEALVLNAQLTTLVAGGYPIDLIGRIVAPPTPAQVIAELAFTWWKFNPAEFLRIKDTKVSKRSTIPITDFAFDSETGVLHDYGEQIITPNSVVRLSETQPPTVMQAPINVRAAKIMALNQRFWLSHEVEAQTLLQTAANFKTGNKATAAAKQKLDDPDNDPLKVILDILDVPLIKPNALIMPLDVFRPVQRHPKVLAALKAVLGGKAALGGQVTAQEMAEYFGLSQVLVPDQRGNTAGGGATATYARLWGKHLTALRIEAPPASSAAPYGGTAITPYGSLMSQSPTFVASRDIPPGAENGGLYGAVADIVGHTRSVVMTNQDSCYLLSDVVS
ncbi:MAG: hypothetical protein NTY01_05585 [Verrucomicrobia bacterium]|nr:hypothetical protein [Verrucomicrobiota bacterium]